MASDSRGMQAAESLEMIEEVSDWEPRGLVSSVE